MYKQGFTTYFKKMIFEKKTFFLNKTIFTIIITTVVSSTREKDTRGRVWDV